MEKYVDEGYCCICKKDTKQEFNDAGHERDSSGDYRICLECGAYYSGYTGKWYQKEKDND